MLTSPLLPRRITLTITAPTHEDADLLSLEIPADTTVSTLKESVQAESQIPKTAQHLYHNGQLLADDSKTMAQLQIGDGEMLALHVRDTTRTARPGQQPQQPRQQAAAPQARGPAGFPDPETIRLQLLGNPELRQQAISQRPELAAVIESPERFAQALQRMQDQEREEQSRRRQQIADLNADPFDVDAQMRIAEMIREERVQENLQNAIEHNPEGEISWRCYRYMTTDQEQCLVAFTCYILTSKSMDTRLKPLSILGHRLLSCLQLAPKHVA
jgi:DNA damage-inducible protein 1